MAAAATVRVEDHRLKPVPRHPTCLAVLDGGPGWRVAWDPEELRSLASAGCRRCWGAGVLWRRGLLGRQYPCGCALRTIFRQCLARYRYYEAHCENLISVRRLLIVKGARRFHCWGRPEQEYCADFEAVGRRTLSGVQYRIFRLHFVHGLPWPECAGRLGIERGMFFHQVYLVEQRMGYALRTVKPYALHPVGEYFCGINEGRL